MSEKIGIRPCVILIENKKVLCVRYCSKKEEFYLFPGGGIEKGETIEEAAIREMEEETGIKVEIEKLAYVNDWIQDKANNLRVVNMFFIGKRISGKELFGEKDGGKVKDIEWIPLNKFRNKDFRPKIIADRLSSDHEEGFLQSAYFN